MKIKDSGQEEQLKIGVIAQVKTDSPNQSEISEKTQKENKNKKKATKNNKKDEKNKMVVRL